MKSYLINILSPSLLALLLLPLAPVLTSASPLIVTGGYGACGEAYQRDTSANIEWVSVWDEAGLRRYRFTFEGADLIANKGQDFLKRIRCHDGNAVANNWACWGPDKDGRWTFDISEYDGAPGAGFVNAGIQDVSGEWPNIPG